MTLADARGSKAARRWSWLSLAVLLVFTEAIYVRPSIFWGHQALLGLDYSQLHMRRMAFARGALFGANHFLPAWYPRELLGTPFSANLQNFPWIPTRLVLLWLDPILAYAAGVAIAAALAAVFTFLFCRRAGLSEIGAITAGWTFACAGFFASRVTAGHLPMLEAYPALPLLLWLADRAVSPDRAQYQVRDLAALSIASACVAVAGHPQIPAYSLGAALLYVILRGRGWRRVKIISAMALGVGTTLAAWWPMLLLVQRSTRVLHLGAASNDIAMPYRRLLALIRPGIDGWPDSIHLGEQNPFSGYPHDGYFWDTTSYIGLLPLLVILLLFSWSLARKRLPGWPWAFLAALGTVALIFALPVVDPLRRMIPGTVFRSPARLLYLSTFSASVALGFGVHAFLASSLFRLRVRQAVVGLALLFHVLDLGGFAWLFVITVPRESSNAPAFEQILAREVKDARIAASDDLMTQYRGRYDDVGVFDSILLAKPYRAILALNGSPADLNEQRLDGSELAIPALQGAGVRFVITTTERTDLELVSSTEDAYLYRVPNPAPRAGLLAENHRDNSVVEYFRPSSDEIRLETAADQAGLVRVLESYDPGWTAEVDGARAPVLLANGFSMAVPVAPGKHTVALRYRTPGRTTGLVLSLFSAALLGCLIWTARRRRPTVPK